MDKKLWTMVLAFGLLGCTESRDDSSRVDESVAVDSDAEVPASSDAGVPPFPDADDAWVPLEGASADLDRYLETVCRIAARCGHESLSLCHAGYEGYYCEPAFRDLELPNLDTCVAVREQSECDDASLKPECFAIRKAMREARGGGTIVGKGEACDSLTIGCDYGLFCTAAPGQCGQCAPPLKEGDTCTSWDSCDRGLYCTDKGVCEKPLVEGSACDPSTDLCEFGLRCEDKKCVPLELGDYGASCASDENCYAGFCVDGTCRGAMACGQGKLGEPCWNDGTCGEGLLCEAYSRRCVAQIADGEPCDFDNPYLCSPNSHCTYADETGTSTICQPKSANGEECFSPGYGYAPECASDWCTEDAKCAERVPGCE